MSTSKLVKAMNHLDDDLILRSICEPFPKKNTWLKWAAAAAVLGLLLGCAIPAWKQWHGIRALPPAVTVPKAENRLLVNEVKAKSYPDIDTKHSFYEQATISDAFQKVIGIEYPAFAARLSGLLTIQAVYSEDVRRSPENSEYKPHDFVFEAQTEAGGKVRLALSALGTPCRCVFFVCDDPASSKIGGTEILIYGIEDTYFARFCHENIYYDLETTNVPLEELEELLSEILRHS